MESKPISTSKSCMVNAKRKGSRRLSRRFSTKEKDLSNNSRNSCCWRKSKQKKRWRDSKHWLSRLKNLNPSPKWCQQCQEVATSKNNNPVKVCSLMSSRLKTCPSTLADLCWRSWFVTIQGLKEFSRQMDQSAELSSGSRLETPPSLQWWASTGSRWTSLDASSKSRLNSRSDQLSIEIEFAHFFHTLFAFEITKTFD